MRERQAQYWQSYADIDRDNRTFYLMAINKLQLFADKRGGAYKILKQMLICRTAASATQKIAIFKQGQTIGGGLDL